LKIAATPWLSSAISTPPARQSKEYIRLSPRGRSRQREHPGGSWTLLFRRLCSVSEFGDDSMGGIWMLRLDFLLPMVSSTVAGLGDKDLAGVSILSFCGDTSTPESLLSGGAGCWARPLRGVVWTAGSGNSDLSQGREAWRPQSVRLKRHGNRRSKGRNKRQIASLPNPICS
jgi:hypothetical protein